MENKVDEKNEPRPLEETIEKWLSNVEDEFGSCIKEICECTQQYFKKHYRTNPMNAFLWFYGFDKDKEKTYEKILSYVCSCDRQRPFGDDALSTINKALLKMRQMNIQEKTNSNEV